MSPTDLRIAAPHAQDDEAGKARFEEIIAEDCLCLSLCHPVPPELQAFKLARTPSNMTMICATSSVMMEMHNPDALFKTHIFPIRIR